MEAWCQFIGQHACADRPSTLDVLHHNGIEISDFESRKANEAGLLFIDEATLEVLDFVATFSGNGTTRLLILILPFDCLNCADLWSLLAAGASDVLVWDSSADSCANIVARLDRWTQVDVLIHTTTVADHLIGQSPKWIIMLRNLIEMARFTTATILITGESGTGKELVARMIHEINGQPAERFVVVDCTTIVPELAGSELFGHERGAFTGASSPRDGAFALAHKGTLFLDEIGELSLPLQAQLLRVVQEKTFKRVGSNTWNHTDFRLVCATNRDLTQAREAGQFRSDLFYRIAGYECRLPSLKERSDDIPRLVRHFFRALRPDEPPPELDEGVKQYLLSRDYPGNIRDLRRIVFQMGYRYAGRGPVTVGAIPPEERPRPTPNVEAWLDELFEQIIRRAVNFGAGLKDIGRAAEHLAVQIAVAEEGGNLQRAAQRLRVSDRALQLRRAAGR